MPLAGDASDEAHLDYLSSRFVAFSFARAQHDFQRLLQMHHVYQYANAQGKSDREIGALLGVKLSRKTFDNAGALDGLMLTQRMYKLRYLRGTSLAASRRITQRLPPTWPKTTTSATGGAKAKRLHTSAARTVTRSTSTRNGLRDSEHLLRAV